MWVLSAGSLGRRNGARPRPATPAGSCTRPRSLGSSTSPSESPHLPAWLWSQPGADWSYRGTRYEWGFSEEYCQCPERLAEAFDDGRSVFWFMIRDGRISGGASVCDPGWAECLALPGFHVAAQWALIANASGMIYGPEGMPQRERDTALLEDNLLIECRPPPSAFLATLQAKPARVPMSEAFPTAIGLALRGSQGLEGLHNAGALVMKRSPEVASLPMSRIGIPALHKMDAAQKEAFYHLLQRPLRPVYGSELRQGGAFGMDGSRAAENEFADRPWCRACAEHGVRLLEMAAEAGELDLCQ
jgi:hypothetical protein